MCKMPKLEQICDGLLCPSQICNGIVAYHHVHRHKLVHIHHKKSQSMKFELGSLIRKSKP